MLGVTDDAKNASTDEFEKGFSIWPDAKADAGSDLDAKFANQILLGLEASRSGYKERIPFGASLVMHCPKNTAQ